MNLKQVFGDAVHKTKGAPTQYPFAIKYLKIFNRPGN